MSFVLLSEVYRDDELIETIVHGTCVDRGDADEEMGDLYNKWLYTVEHRMSHDDHDVVVEAFAFRPEYTTCDVRLYVHAFSFSAYDHRSIEMEHEYKQLVYSLSRRGEAKIMCEVDMVMDRNDCWLLCDFQQKVNMLFRSLFDAKDYMKMLVRTRGYEGYSITPTYAKVSGHVIDGGYWYDAGGNHVEFETTC